MKRNELLKRFKVTAIRKANKGEIILATKNHGGSCEAVVVSRDSRYVVSEILKEI
jgi:hypothetical protein